MRLIALFLSCQLAAVLARAAVAPDTTLITTKYTNVTPLVVGPNDGLIAKVTVRILENSHYLRKPFNDEVSARFLDRYLDLLDNLHLYFTQADVKEFDEYRTLLDDLTKEGDTTPARTIFARFRQRLDQNYEYVTALLKTEKWDFNADERYVVNRRELPRPKDLAEAQKFWRDRVRFEYLQEKLNKEKPDEIVKIIARRYNRLLRMINDYDEDDVLQLYLSALTRVYDPHSDYMGKAEFDNFSIGMKLSLYGIGALLRSEDGICRIQSLTPGSPAEKSMKLRPNDKIVAVAQSNQPPVEVVDMPLRKVVDLIRGPKDTEVRLTVIPADAPDSSVRKIVSIIRDEIKLEEGAAKARLYEMPADKNGALRLGVIDLPSFYSSFELEGRNRNGSATQQKSTTVDVARLLKKLTQENVAGVILDLRRNGGGSLEEAINLSGLFINEGPIVQVKDAAARIFVDNDPNEPYAGEYYKGPVVVLTSRFSASASEILAGALQDYGRALIVGESSTHGKGTVQSLIQLGPILRSALVGSNNPGAVKVTIRKFYRASGGSTQLKGVIPDIILPSIYNDAKIGEDALENPLEWDTIPSASHEKLNRVAPYLAELKKRSDLRVAADRDFASLREEIARAKKAQDEKSVSLNEAQRLKEKEEADARAKTRKKELAARPEPPGKVYEITLKNVDDPGLPPPVTKTNTVKTTSATETPRPGVFRETKASPKETKTAASASKADKRAPARKGAGQVAETKDPPPADADDEEHAAEDSVTVPDIALEEARRILADYIELTAKAGPVVVSKPDGAK
jgi:carboxyl-terminal processing protease